MIFITSYKNPDIDWFACSFAYSELLNKLWKNASYGFLWVPHKEVNIVLEKYYIPFINDFEKIKNTDSIILVDTSNKNWIPKWIDIKQIIEVIDHRKSNEKDIFFNAKIQIEYVWSCATLIAEKFVENSINFSKESAILLYFAIQSNTIKLTNNVTTKRDIEIVKYIENNFDIAWKEVDEVFRLKSNIWDNLKQAFLSDIKTIEKSIWKIAIIQVEVEWVKEILNKNFNEIKEILSEIKNQEKINYIFISFIDLSEKCNYFISFDNIIINKLEDVLNIKFIKNISKNNNTIMRKEIIPLL